MRTKDISEEVGVSREVFKMLRPEARSEFAISLSKFLLKASHPDVIGEETSLFAAVNDALEVLEEEKHKSDSETVRDDNQLSLVKAFSLQTKWAGIAHTILLQIGANALQYIKDSLKPLEEPTVLSPRPIAIELSDPGTFILLHEIFTHSNPQYRIEMLPQSVLAKLREVMARIDSFDPKTHDKERFEEVGGIEKVLREYTKRTILLHEDGTIEIHGDLENGIFKDKFLIGTCGAPGSGFNDLDFLDRVIPHDFDIKDGFERNRRKSDSPSRASRYVLVGEVKEGESGTKQRNLRMDEFWQIVRNLSLELRKRHYLFSFNCPAGQEPFYRYEGVVDKVTPWDPAVDKEGA